MTNQIKFFSTLSLTLAVFIAGAFLAGLFPTRQAESAIGVAITALSPSSGKVGTEVTISGAEFASTGNNIHFGVGGIANVSSTDGMTLKFVVPGGISACDFMSESGRIFCGSPTYQVVDGTYDVYVSHAGGSSNVVKFTVTSSGVATPTPTPTPCPTGYLGGPGACISPTPTKLAIASIMPLSGPIGTTVKITGSGFTSSNTVNFGAGSFPGYLSSDGGTVINFKIPDYLSKCSEVACLNFISQVVPGDYQVYITNANGTSNTVMFKVTGTSVSPTPTPSIVFCTADAKLCPDGSYVGRTGPNCEFVCPTPTPTLCISLPNIGCVPRIYSASEIRSGDTISASGSSDPDVYITNEFGYKRLFLNPVIFNFYGHLGGFSSVKTVAPATRDNFVTSLLFRNCEANDPRVYAVQPTGEDTGMLHWLNESGAQAVAEDPNFFKKVFCINNNEFNWYSKGADYTSVSQVPAYSR